MLQYKRILMFIPLSVLLPALVIAVLVQAFSQLGVSIYGVWFSVTSHIADTLLAFLIYWWLAKGVNKSPYLHAFVVYFCSSLISIFALIYVAGESFISTKFAIDVLVTIIVIFIATRVGFKNEETPGDAS